MRAPSLQPEIQNPHPDKLVYPYEGFLEIFHLYPAPPTKGERLEKCEELP